MMKNSILFFLSFLLLPFLSQGQTLGETFYDLVDGSILSSDGAVMDTAVSADTLFSIGKGSGSSFKDHGSGHGGVFSSGNQFHMYVSDSARIAFEICQYSAVGATLEITDEEGTSLGSILGEGQTAQVDDSVIYFTYSGEPQLLTATIVAGGSVYMHGITICNYPDIAYGETIYELTDGSLLDYDGGTDTAFICSDDGCFIMKQGEGSTFYSHQDSHGGTFSNGNQFKLFVADKATIGFEVCIFSKVGATLEITDEEGNLLGTILGEGNTAQVEDSVVEFEYEGTSQYLTATIVSGGTVYMHSVRIMNTPEALIGETHYDLNDGSILDHSGTAMSSAKSEDGHFMVLQGDGGTFKDHLSGHGGVFSNGNQFKMFVANRAKVSFEICAYSAAGAYLMFTDEEGTELGSILGEGRTANVDDSVVTFAYEGSSQWLTATIVADGSVYMHAVSVLNYEPVTGLDGMVQVWDFGAQRFGTDTLNMLTVDSINNWFDASITPGTASTDNKLPEYIYADPLTWVGKANSDRLRTSNDSLTCYDDNVGDTVTYSGRIYANGTVTIGDDGWPGNRYFLLDLTEDDEVSIAAISQNSSGMLTFAYYEDSEVQFDQYSTTSKVAAYDFIAKATGTYIIYDEKDKGSYYRFIRKNAEYVAVSGLVDETLASTIPEGYGIVFTNSVTGKAWTAVVSDGAYSLEIPAGHTYDLSLSNANGYIISSGLSASIAGETELNITVEQIDLFTVSGYITGLGDYINNLTLVYTADPAENKIYVPEVSIDKATGAYTAVLEPNCAYTISAEGVNDFEIVSNTITITGDEAADVTFSAKAVYAITLTTTGLDSDLMNLMEVTFTNLYEEGYVYTFSDLDAILLRDGVYTVAVDGLDDYAVALALTSNLEVNGEPTSKELAFEEVREWTFDDKDITGSSYYGLLFSGSVSNQAAKGHLTAKYGASIKVPVKVGDKMLVTYYYSAAFSIEGGDTITTASGSTSTKEMVSYTYTGSENDTLTIVIGSTASTTYITNIKVLEVMDYTAEITVGTGKDFATINEALDAISRMERTDDQRVTVVIDPGNYEEMLVIDQDNITFANASENPSIELANAGVDINAEAVRITSYYGYGYNYYSMDNQRWDEDVLRVNKENGYFSYENQSGSTNDSYWNTTVLVTGQNFIAKDIIFENSFNQYISAKEAADVVVEKSTGGKGTRPTEAGNTDVQMKSYIERAAALAVDGGDKMILINCKLIGHQDVFYGNNARVVIYKGDMVGGTDYIFGGMTAIFYKTTLSMNTADDVSTSDVSYITAGQQDAGERGYLMYECTISSAEPGVENIATYRSKPGYFGRCWSGVNCEVIWYKTTIETTDHPRAEGESLIEPAGWMDGLGGPSPRVGEYGTIEESGVDNSANRVSGGDWGETTILTEEILRDAVTALTTFNFTKGTDDWDPIEALVAEYPDADTTDAILENILDARIYAAGETVYIRGLQESTNIQVYNTQGQLMKSFEASDDLQFSLPTGCWIVRAYDRARAKTVKVTILE